MADAGPFQQLLGRSKRQPPLVAIVLGSGLADVAETVRCQETVDFAAVPGLPAPSTPGHRGKVILGSWGGQTVLVFSGRVHFYEGHSWDKVLRPIRLARELGARYLLLTCAAGGIRDDLMPGSLLTVADHLDWTRADILSTAGSACQYDPALQSLVQQAGRDMGLTLPTGRYGQVTGPCYETLAEIRALRSLGVDAVGMSTAREAEAGFAVGLACAAICCISNQAAGLGPGRIHHEDVLANAAPFRERLAELLERVLRRL